MSASPVPRGRHAPPLEVRQAVQRQRLLRAAATVFARSGYAKASAEGIAREAGMSKATFYEHFADKEDCILELFEDVATRLLTRLAETAAPPSGYPDYPARVRSRITDFLQAAAAEREAAQTLLVEVIGAGPKAADRRDAMLDALASAIYEDNRAVAPRYGAPTYASPQDAYAVVAAIAELLGRHLRKGEPAEVLDLLPVLERLFLGVLAQGAAPAAA